MDELKKICASVNMSLTLPWPLPPDMQTALQGGEILPIIKTADGKPILKKFGEKEDDATVDIASILEYAKKGKLEFSAFKPLGVLARVAYFVLAADKEKTVSGTLEGVTDAKGVESAWSGITFDGPTKGTENLLATIIKKYANTPGDTENARFQAALKKTPNEQVYTATYLLIQELMKAVGGYEHSALTTYVTTLEEAQLLPEEDNDFAKVYIFTAEKQKFYFTIAGNPPPPDRTGNATPRITLSTTEPWSESPAEAIWPKAEDMDKPNYVGPATLFMRLLSSYPGQGQGGALPMHLATIELQSLLSVFTDGKGNLNLGNSAEAEREAKDLQDMVEKAGEEGVILRHIIPKTFTAVETQMTSLHKVQNNWVDLYADYTTTLNTARTSTLAHMHKTIQIWEYLKDRKRALEAQARDLKHSSKEYWNVLTYIFKNYSANTADTASMRLQEQGSLVHELIGIFKTGGGAPAAGEADKSGSGEAPAAGEADEAEEAAASKSGGAPAAGKAAAERHKAFHVFLTKVQTQMTPSDTPITKLRQEIEDFNKLHTSSDTEYNILALKEYVSTLSAQNTTDLPLPGFDANSFVEKKAGITSELETLTQEAPATTFEDIVALVDNYSADAADELMTKYAQHLTHKFTDTLKQKVADVRFVTIKKLDIEIVTNPEIETESIESIESTPNIVKVKKIDDLTLTLLTPEGGNDKFTPLDLSQVLAVTAKAGAELSEEFI